MRSAVFKVFGDPSQVLKIEDSPMPHPGPNAVRVKTILSAIHNHDLLTIFGLYGYKPELPAIAGSEAVGIVDALGEGVNGLTVGQRVSVAGAPGTWAEYFVADAHSVAPVPETIPDESAAQLIGMPLSALFLLKFIEAQRGHWIAQNAATGAVATALAMTAQARGINVVNLVRQQDAVEVLAGLGIQNGISTDQQGWQRKVQDIVGNHPIRAAIDGVGGSASTDLLSLLSDNGVLVSFGAMSGKPMEIPPGDLIFKQAMVKGFWFSKLRQTTPLGELGLMIGELLNLVEQGIIRLQVDKVFDLNEVTDAVKANAAPARRGKILVRI
jgi:NADPH:quinone reductase